MQSPTAMDWPGAAWPGIDSAGWSEDRFAALTQALSEHGSTAFAIVAGGRPVFAWGDLARRSSIASVRKSLIALLYGIEVDAGTIDPDTSLADLGIDDIGGLSATERTATIRHLLMARSGIYLPSVYDTSVGRPERSAYEPGTHWFYNNWDFNVLGSIYERCTGRTIFDGFAEKLAGPLGLEDFRPSDGLWVDGPESIHPVYKFKLSGRDLARIGLLVLRGGLWQNTRLISTGWINLCLSPHSEVAAGRGYGYLWWTAEANASGDPMSISHPIAYASGFGGQYLVIVPELDVVVVHRAADHERPVSHKHMGDILRLAISASPATMFL